MRWIFVLNPPLLRPIAWSSPSFWAPALCWCLRPLSIECRRAADGDAPAWPPRSISMGRTSRPCQRHQGLAVRNLAQRRSILGSDPHRMHAFLGNRSVVDHRHGIAATNERAGVAAVSSRELGEQAGSIGSSGWGQPNMAWPERSRRLLWWRSIVVAKRGRPRQRHVDILSIAAEDI